MEQPVAPVQPAAVQQGVSAPQPAVFAAAFPTTFPASQPTASGHGGNGGLLAATSPLQGVPSGGAAWGGPFGPGQPNPPQQGSRQAVAGPQTGGELGLTSQPSGQQEAVRVAGAPGNAGPGSPSVTGSSQAGLTGSSVQATPSPATLAGVTGSRPLEGFGEIEPRPAVQAPARPPYGAGWPQQGAAGYAGLGVGRGSPQGFGQAMQAPGVGLAPGVGPAFSGAAPQQGFGYAYHPQGQAPWLQQAGPLAGPGAGYGGFGGQASTSSGGPGQTWPYQQQAGGGGHFAYQAPFVGGGLTFPPVAQQAPPFPSQTNVTHLGSGVPGASGTIPTASAWSATAGPGPGMQTPAILPPWMIQPQQAPSSGAGNQGQGVVSSR